MNANEKGLVRMEKVQVEKGEIALFIDKCTLRKGEVDSLYNDIVVVVSEGRRYIISTNALVKYITLEALNALKSKRSG